MAKKFGELRKKMSPEAQKKARVPALRYSEEMSLGEPACAPVDAGAPGKNERKK